MYKKSTNLTPNIHIKKNQNHCCKLQHYILRISSRLEKKRQLGAQSIPY